MNEHKPPNDESLATLEETEDCAGEFQFPTVLMMQWLCVCMTPSIKATVNQLAVVHIVLCLCGVVVLLLSLVVSSTMITKSSTAVLVSILLLYNLLRLTAHGVLSSFTVVDNRVLVQKPAPCLQQLSPPFFSPALSYPLHYSSPPPPAPVPSVYTLRHYPPPLPSPPSSNLPMHYSRDQLLEILPSTPNFELVNHLRELRLGVGLPRKRGCRGGRKKLRSIQVVPSRNLRPLMIPPFLQPHPDLQSAVGNAPLSSKHPTQLPTTDCLLSIIPLMGGQPSDDPALSPPSPLQQGGQSSNAPALSPPSPLPQGGQPIALALSPSSPPPQDGQPSDAPGLSPSSSTLLLCPSDSTLSICHLNSQSAVKTERQSGRFSSHIVEIFKICNAAWLLGTWGVHYTLLGLALEQVLAAFRPKLAQTFFTPIKAIRRSSLVMLLGMLASGNALVQAARETEVVREEGYRHVDRKMEGKEGDRSVDHRMVKKEGDRPVDHQMEGKEGDHPVDHQMEGKEGDRDVYPQ
ncbi:hypothetical protein ACOMHN_062155 [Nucella lapillus]